MALIIEDGTGDDPTANSFGTLTEIREYNASRGRAALGADGEVEGFAIRAMDYIIAREPDMLGFRTFGLDQPLPYPREDVWIAGEYLGNQEIPQQLINAQAELVWAIHSGIDLMPNIHEAPLKRRKVGPLEREWFAPAGPPEFPIVMSWLRPLLLDSGFTLRTVRI
jgi:hypothetical protein